VYWNVPIQTVKHALQLLVKMCAQTLYRAKIKDPSSFVALVRKAAAVAGQELSEADESILSILTTDQSVDLVGSRDVNEGCDVSEKNSEEQKDIESDSESVATSRPGRAHLSGSAVSKKAILADVLHSGKVDVNSIARLRQLLRYNAASTGRLQHSVVRRVMTVLQPLDVDSCSGDDEEAISGLRELLGGGLTSLRGRSQNTVKRYPRVEDVRRDEGGDILLCLHPTILKRQEQKSAVALDAFTADVEAVAHGVVEFILTESTEAALMLKLIYQWTSSVLAENGNDQGAHNATISKRLRLKQAALKITSHITPLREELESAMGKVDKLLEPLFSAGRFEATPFDSFSLEALVGKLRELSPAADLFLRAIATPRRLQLKQRKGEDVRVFTKRLAQWRTQREGVGLVHLMRMHRVSSAKRVRNLSLLCALINDAFNLPGPYRDLLRGQGAQAGRDIASMFLDDRAAAAPEEIANFMREHSDHTIIEFIDNAMLQTSGADHKNQRSDRGSNLDSTKEFTVGGGVVVHEQFSDMSSECPQFLCTLPEEGNRYYGQSLPSVGNGVQFSTCPKMCLELSAADEATRQVQTHETGRTTVTFDESGLVFEQFRTLSELMAIAPALSSISPNRRMPFQMDMTEAEKLKEIRTNSLSRELSHAQQHNAALGGLGVRTGGGAVLEVTENQTWNTHFAAEKAKTKGVAGKGSEIAAARGLGGSGEGGRVGGGNAMGKTSAAAAVSHRRQRWKEPVGIAPWKNQERYNAPRQHPQRVQFYTASDGTLRRRAAVLFTAPACPESELTLIGYIQCRIHFSHMMLPLGTFRYDGRSNDAGQHIVVADQLSVAREKSAQQAYEERLGEILPSEEEASKTLAAAQLFCGHNPISGGLHREMASLASILKGKPQWYYLISPLILILGRTNIHPDKAGAERRAKISLLRLIKDAFFVVAARQFVRSDSYAAMHRDKPGVPPLAPRFADEQYTTAVRILIQCIRRRSRIPNPEFTCTNLDPLLSRFPPHSSHTTCCSLFNTPHPPLVSVPRSFRNG
jgi:hypothetical protein